MTNATMVYDVIENNGKFIVTKNGQPILLPKNSESTIVTEFDCRDDAEKYISILKKLKQPARS